MPSKSRSRATTESRYLGVGSGMAQHQKDLPEETKTYLSEVERRDMEMEQIELTRVGDGVNQLKHVALEMNERIKTQSVELDPIAGQLAGYREDMGVVKARLKKAAKKGKRWGGFGRNVLCMFVLVGQILALGFLVDFIIKEHRKS